jgi:Uma2 family endonuclease
MSVLSTSAVARSSPRLLTVADLAMLPSELPSGTVRYELDNGQLVIYPPHGDAHAAVVAAVAAELALQGQRRGLGKVRCGGLGLILWRNPDRVIGADVAFLGEEQLPARVSQEDYLETMPALVVEVRDVRDADPEVERKVKDYLTAGVRVVWVADPDARTVTAYRTGQPPQVFRDTDTLTAADVIPGFQVPVANLFQV